MPGIRELSRRDFVKLTAGAGAGLLFGIRLGEDAAADAGIFAPNAFLMIDPQGMVTITVARSELGQGARTVVPMIVGDELGADWSMVRVVPAQAEERFGNMTTGGSTTVRLGWMPLRRAGAAAREMLIDAAAEMWGVSRALCTADGGAVLGPDLRKAGFGELVARAAARTAPSDPPLKDPRDFRWIGKGRPRLDGPEKVAGRAVFGFDLRLPRMLIAAVAQAPVPGAKVAGFDASRAQAVPGVRQVVELPTGVAVIAESTWAAWSGRDALDVRWDEGENAALSTESLRASFHEKLAGPAVTARHDGDAGAAFASAARTIEATFEVPFLAHAALEPVNCTADVGPEICEIWVPTQAPQWAQRAAAGVLDLPLEKVRVNTTLSGGAFGRRLNYDFVGQAVRLSRAANAPVKVVWTREDDMRHDFYRPMSVHRVSAALDANGGVTAWSHRIVAPSIAVQLFGEEAAAEGPDAVDGAAGLPYRIPNVLVEYVRAETPVPVGWWRSVYNTQNAFVNECFIDEIARAAGLDPLEMRLGLLPKASRLRGVLERAAERAGWGRPLPAGRFHGIACHESFGSFVAQVAEISPGPPVRVHRVFCAVDCGIAVHPDGVVAQMEGGILFGLSAALTGRITHERGRVREASFDDYPVLRMADSPAIEVEIIASGEAPGGAGEPGVPAIAPAVANALRAATGVAVRRLPLSEEQGPDPR